MSQSFFGGCFVAFLSRSISSLLDSKERRSTFNRMCSALFLFGLVAFAEDYKRTKGQGERQRVYRNNPGCFRLFCCIGSTIDCPGQQENLSRLLLEINMLTGSVTVSVCTLRNEDVGTIGTVGTLDALTSDCGGSPPESQCAVTCCTDCLIG
jgi:hypothetical protein